MRLWMVQAVAGLFRLYTVKKKHGMFTRTCRAMKKRPERFR